MSLCKRWLSWPPKKTKLTCTTLSVSTANHQPPTCNEILCQLQWQQQKESGETCKSWQQQLIITRGCGLSLILLFNPLAIHQHQQQMVTLRNTHAPLAIMTSWSSGTHFHMTTNRQTKTVTSKHLWSSAPPTLATIYSHNTKYIHGSTQPSGVAHQVPWQPTMCNIIHKAEGVGCPTAYPQQCQVRMPWQPSTAAWEEYQSYP